MAKSSQNAAMNASAHARRTGSRYARLGVVGWEGGRVVRPGKAGVCLITAVPVRDRTMQFTKAHAALLLHLLLPQTDETGVARL